MGFLQEHRQKDLFKLFHYPLNVPVDWLLFKLMFKLWNKVSKYWNEWKLLLSSSDYKPQGNWRYNIALYWFIWQLYHSNQYKVAFSLKSDCRILYSVGFQVFSIPFCLGWVWLTSTENRYSTIVQLFCDRNQKTCKILPLWFAVFSCGLISPLVISKSYSIIGMNDLYRQLFCKLRFLAFTSILLLSGISKCENFFQK